MTARALAAAFALLFTVTVYAQAPQEQTEGSVLNSISWVRSGKGDMKDVASIAIPQGYVFAASSDTARLMELMQNPVSGREVGFLAPEDMNWFMVFEFDAIGYVKDDERDELDADTILKNIREGTAAANEERKKRGWATLDILGWEQKPRYDSATNNLTWAIRGRSEGKDVINYNTRLLGRDGVMEVALVCGPEELAAVTPVAQKLLHEYSFNPGKRYAEFKDGDKVAAVGLAALIAGGGAAVAAKTGLLAKILKALGKFGVFIALAVAAAFKKLFGKKDEALPRAE